MASAPRPQSATVTAPLSEGTKAMQLMASGGGLDKLAIALSGLCAVHCLVSAILLALLASAGGVFFDHIVHEIGLGVASILAAIAFVSGFMRHRLIAPLTLGGIGIAVMAGALQLHDHGGEIIGTLIGVTILSLGHYLNRRAVA
ncbi:MerC domain-containing protein [Alterisphingorhabdus coralli]|uniref:MerC domain-containing protein n=1 Tax=Alterisphingorhabdus coralli TaxID=3071408 RepID=A0AA97I1E5_9SPHN|nr:MerC domain-containing protein [Parasphingorhabdus sp. SCSIO 66989]WOE75303.1 MerC domain-containing protein [Parasphingorhabdus sp. SCSIO 66989]